MCNINTFLLFWGFTVVTIKPDGVAIQIDLTPRATRFPSCAGTKSLALALMNIAKESFVTCPISAARRTSTPLAQTRSPSYWGKRMETVSRLVRHAGMTRRLVEAVIQAGERLPTLHTARIFRTESYLNGLPTS